MASDKTLTDLVTMVRDNIDETTPSFWTAAEVIRFLNKAKDRVAAEVRKLKDDAFSVTRLSTDGALTILGESYAASGFAVAVGTRDYTLPPDLLEVSLIEVVTSGYEGIRFVHRKLSHPDMRAAMETPGNVGPSAFWFSIIGERTMRIAPKSDTALDLSLTYIQFFPDLSDGGDLLTMPHPLYLAVVEYATAAAMLKDRDPNAAAHEAQAKQIIEDVFGGSARQSQDQEVATAYMEDW